MMLNILLFLLQILLLSSCITFEAFHRLNEHSLNNARDYEFLMDRIQKKSRHSFDQGIVSSYRNVWGKALYSECKNVPSDSTFIMLYKKNDCSYTYGFLKSVGRLLREHDLHLVSPSSPISINGRLGWVDFPSTCRMFID